MVDNPQRVQPSVETERGVRGSGLGQQRTGTRERRAPCSTTSLPAIDDVVSVPVEQVPSLLVHLSALQAALAARLATVEHPASPTGRLLTAKELAAAIRYSLDTVYDMARTGRIPVAARKGRAIRFDLLAVRRALAS